MAAGSTIAASKQLLVDLISARLGQTANVSYSNPTDAQDLQAENGSLALVYLDPQIDTRYEVIILGASTLRIDEHYTIPVIVEVQSGNGETQQDCDALVDELLHGVLGAVAQNPSLTWTDTTELQMFSAIPSGGTRTADTVGGSANYFATKHVINVDVYARLILT